ncbi:acyl-CoA dehydrogenase [Francisella sp. W12-1067]|nr:acyl-CoA dehydrogenase [Francisella sp. W12-1067]
MNKFAIVGAGFSGTCALWHLVKNIANNNCKDYEIHIIEKSNVCGPGFPYYKYNNIQSYLCNNPADQMFIDNNDFVSWVDENKDFILNQYSELVDGCYSVTQNKSYIFDHKAFYPREFFGIYLTHRFKEAIYIAKNNRVNIKTYNLCEVLDMDLNTYNKVNILYIDKKNNSKHLLYDIDRVLLATGHWNKNISERIDNIINMPYPPEIVANKIINLQRKNRSKDIDVYIEGMGPSGVDSILNICQYGKFIYDNGAPIDYVANWNTYEANKVNIVAISRSGIFPGVRTEKVLYEPYFLSEKELFKSFVDGYIPLKSIINLIDLELKHQSEGQLTLNDFVNASNITAEDKLMFDLKESKNSKLLYTIILHVRRFKFYRYLSSRDKKEYDQLWDRHFIRVAVPIPKINAIKLKILFSKGILKALKLNDLPDEYFYSQNIIIKASGMGSDVLHHSSDLIKNLLRKKIITPALDNHYNMGGINVDRDNSFKVYQYINDKEELSSRIYSFGPIIAHWKNTDNYAGAFVEAAKRISQEWIQNKE